MSIYYFQRVARKTKTETKPYAGPVFGVGETVLIRRPHLWSGCVGEVKSVKEGIHRIAIVAKEDGSTTALFHTDASGEVLEVWL